MLALSSVHRRYHACARPAVAWPHVDPKTRWPHIAECSQINFEKYTTTNAISLPGLYIGKNCTSHADRRARLGSGAPPQGQGFHFIGFIGLGMRKGAWTHADKDYEPIHLRTRPFARIDARAQDYLQGCVHFAAGGARGVVLRVLGLRSQRVRCDMQRNKVQCELHTTNGAGWRLECNRCQQLVPVFRAPMYPIPERRACGIAITVGNANELSPSTTDLNTLIILDHNRSENGLRMHFGNFGNCTQPPPTYCNALNKSAFVLLPRHVGSGCRLLALACIRPNKKSTRTCF